MSLSEKINTNPVIMELIHEKFGSDCYWHAWIQKGFDKTTFIFLVTDKYRREYEGNITDDGFVDWLKYELVNKEE